MQTQIDPQTRQQKTGQCRQEIAAWERFNDQVRGQQESVDTLVQHLIGLTAEDARRLFRLSLRDDGMITQADIPRVLKAKHDLFSQGGVINLELDVEVQT